MPSQLDYIYPDKSDIITQRMIAQNGSNYVKYWTYSEEKLLEKLFSMPFFARKPLSLLDVGCGEGRLFHYFTKNATSIVGLEPDVSRYESAKQTAEILNAKNPNCRIECINESFDDVEELALYDVVLSSHVLQHISSCNVDLHLEKMVKYTAPNGVIIIHTTYTAKEEDVFLKSKIDATSQKWQETEIDQKKFDELVNSEDTLPVHMFALSTLEKKMKRMGFELIFRHLFHAGKDLVERFGIEEADEMLNNPDHKYCSGGRDVSMVFKKATKIKKGSLTGCYPFAVNLQGVKDIQELKEHFGGEHMSESSCGSFMENCTGQCLNAARKFHQRSDNSLVDTLFLGTSTLTIPLRDFGTVPICFWIDFFKNDNVGVLCCSMLIKNRNVKEIIALKNFFKQECIMKADPSWSQLWKIVNDNRSSITQFCDRIAGEMINYCNGKKIKTNKVIDNFNSLETKKLQYCLLEIDEIDGEKVVDAKEFVLRHKLEMYGLMTGDEGFSYVPESIAEKRLTDFAWQTRKFTYFAGFGKNALIINGKCQLSEYIQDQTDYVDKYEIEGDGSRQRKNYFRLNACLAGVDHGILDTVEDVLVILMKIQHLSSNDFKDNQDDVDNVRQKLKLFLHSNKFQIEEINSLKQVVSMSFGLPELINETKGLLKTITDDINIQDQIDLNTLMAGLTLGTVIVGLFTITTVKASCLHWGTMNIVFILIVSGIVFVVLLDILHEFSIIRCSKRIIKRAYRGICKHFHK
ncbi:MAG: class I SAM-dependent methyltransferase [Bacteroidales bacterium]|nr:class I SAM-dependent methyltransferase [Bacteroidales bacterium]